MTNAYIMLLPLLIIAVVFGVLFCCPVLWQALLIIVGVVALVILGVLIGLNYRDG